ncbi:diacylglycerol O-acyltransferase [Actinomadura cremea]|nr:diacylglycerol O-acyltransferase [Actinomadura cremea]
MGQLTTVDATFLHAESGTTHAHIAGVGVVDPAGCPGGRLTVPLVASLIRERAHLAAPLRQRLVQVPFSLDHPYWEDDPDFMPERHISEVGLPPPGTRRQLADIVAMLHERPLDRARPLWEIVIVQGLEGGLTAVYAKVHHAATDGVMAAETLAALLDLTPEPRDVHTDAERIPERAPALGDMLRTGLLKAALHPAKAALSMARAVPHVDEIPGVAAIPGVGLASAFVQGALRRDGLPRVPRSSAPPTPFNRPIGPRRAVACGELPLDEIKKIGRGLGGSVNDVVMALCATALRQWLDKRGELPDRPLVAGVPVSLRGGRSTTDACNQVSIMTTPLATHIPDPAVRYTAVRRDMDLVKRRFAVTSGSWVRELSGLVPAPVAGPLTRLVLQAGAAVSLRPINLVISNVPGPQFPLYLCGARVLGYYPISVVTDVSGGLNVTVFSYDGKVDIGIVACRDLIPDPAEIIDHLEDALDELRALATD